METKIAITAHGFWDFDGVATTDRLRPFLEAVGYQVQEWDYGFTGLLGVRFLNGKRAKELAGIAKQNPGCVGIGHSNGCALLYRACTEHAAPFSQLVFINPALDEDVEFPSYLKHIHVWYSPHDYPVKFAGLFYKHTWGKMGQVGATRKDPRVSNYNKESELFRIKSYTHLDMFLPEKLDYFGPIIVKELASYERR
jgi:hypothetical protein